MSYKHMGDIKINEESKGISNRSDSIQEFIQKREYLESHKLLSDKKEVLEARLYEAHGIRYDEVRGTSNKTTIDRIIEIDDINAQMIAIEESIKRISKLREVTLLQYRYVLHMSVKEIAKATKYSTKQVNRKVNVAIELLNI